MMLMKIIHSIIYLLLLSTSMTVMAESADSTKLRPKFALEYTGELQTDFKTTSQVNLLQLRAELPLSRSLSFQAASLSVASTQDDLLFENMMGYSNIDAYDKAFALMVAGFQWNINNRHTLFAGVRRMDEDYFCSDGMSLYTNPSCGIFPTISSNYFIATYPYAAMGLHYTYETDRLCLQASIYNGTPSQDFTGRDNVFRICPKSDGVFALGQAEYRYRDSHYFLGASLYNGYDYDLYFDGEELQEEPLGRKTYPTMWAYAEQALSSRCMLIAAYGHSFSSDNLVRNYYGLGAQYALGKLRFGLYSDHVRVLGVNEWNTELVCHLDLNDYLSVKPVLHILNSDGKTQCIGLLRLTVNLNN